MNPTPKHTVILFLLVTLLGCARSPLVGSKQQDNSKQEHTGPFGFWRGMTKQQIIQDIGREAVVKEDQNGMLTLKKAPAPHPAFESYLVIIAPDAGLVKVIAVGKSINTNDAGDQIKSEFRDLRQALVERYGPSEDLDKLAVHSIWTRQNEWMMSLLKKDRYLSSYWTAPPAKAKIEGITAIGLKANATNSVSGYVILNYEFEGFEKYADQVKASQNSVF